MLIFVETIKFRTVLVKFYKISTLIDMKQKKSKIVKRSNGHGKTWVRIKTIVVKINPKMH